MITESYASSWALSSRCSAGERARREAPMPEGRQGDASRVGRGRCR